MPCELPPAIHCQMPDNPAFDYGICVQRSAANAQLNGDLNFDKTVLRQPFYRPEFNTVLDRQICKITVEGRDGSKVKATIYYRYGDQCVAMPTTSLDKCPLDR